MFVQTNTINTLGFVAGALTTASFAPQVYKAWRTKHCDDLSWGMVLMFAGGIGLWLIYGFLEWSAPIIASNGATLAQVLVIAGIKMRYRRR